LLLVPFALYGFVEGAGDGGIYACHIPIITALKNIEYPQGDDTVTYGTVAG